jgi:hypothetical protein
MKKLEISQMENLQGGNVNWKCVGAAFMLGLGVGLIETGAGAVIAGIGGSYYYDKCSFGG